MKFFSRLIFCLSVIMLFALPGFSQNVYAIKDISDFGNQVLWKKAGVSTKTIAGTPYLYEEFREGEVYIEGKYKLEHVPLRLNLYSGDMEFMSKNAALVIAEPAKVDKIVIGQETFIYLEKDQESQVSGYVKLWNDGYPAIITKMRVDYFDKEPVKPYIEPKPDRYERALDEIYLLLEDGNVERVKSVKKLIQLLGVHEDEMKEFAKKEKTSSTDDAELAAFIEYFRKLD